jgi:hypothetical protein
MPILGTVASQFSGKSFTSFESISTATVGSAGVVEFSSIPSTYKHLQIRYKAKVASQTAAYLRFNGDTGANYAWHYLDGNGTSATAAGYADQAQIGFTPPDSGIGSSQFAVGVVDIVDYESTTKFKTVKTFCGYGLNGAGSDVALDSGLWRNTSAINSITITTFGTNFSTGTNFALYGIKGT